MRTLTAFTLICLLFGFVANSYGVTWGDCGSTLAQRLVRFQAFTAFPSPAQASQYLHLRSSVVITAPINAGSVSILVDYLNNTGEPILNVTGIELCNFTTAISCSKLQSTNETIPINFDWMVPSLPPGDYELTFLVTTPGNQNLQGCLNFLITIENPAVTADEFISSFAANLVGTAYYNVPFASLTPGNLVQVGPVGNLTDTALPWGTFNSITGTGDIIHPFFDTTNYIWGLSGTVSKSTTHDMSVSVLYSGEFYVGYLGPYGSYDTLDNFLLTGTFTLNASSVSNGSPSLTGTINFFDPEGVFPARWFNPLSVARLGTAYVTTNDEGQLMVMGTKPYCISTCNVFAAPPPSGNGNGGLSGWKLGVAIAVPIGVVLLAVLIAGIVFFARRSKRLRDEDAVLGLNRKPEYGSALVVDDIIQETKGHNGAALPVLDHTGKAFPPAYLDDYPMPEYNTRAPRRQSQGQGRGRPRPRSERRSGVPDYSEDDRSLNRNPRGRRPRSVYQETEYSDSEPVNSSHASSVSRSPRSGRSRSPSRGSRSFSPGSRSSDSLSGRRRSRSPSFSETGSDVSGSSRSRSGSSRSPSRSESDRSRDRRGSR